MNKWIASIFVCISILWVADFAMAADAELNCNTDPPTFDSKEPDKKKNTRNPKEFMKWKVEAPENTVIKIEFVKKGTALGESPFADGLDFFYLLVKHSNDMVEWGPIADLTNDPPKQYNYRITCIMGND